MSELLPCPFCGRTDGFQVKTVWKTWRFVACRCKAAGAPARDDEGAIANWNTRRAPARPRDEAVDYLCDMCANDCDERREIRVGQGAYDVCERWEEMRDEGTA